MPPPRIRSTAPTTEVNLRKTEIPLSKRNIQENVRAILAKNPDGQNHHQVKVHRSPPCQKTIFWLNSMASTGKSTIAQTIARTLTKAKWLAANFLFSRGRGDLSDIGKFFSIVGIQLTATSRRLKHYICEAIARNKGISRQSMRDQWTKLVYQPLLKLGDR